MHFVPSQIPENVKRNKRRGKIGNIKEKEEST
jgi:hypothetical protein